MQCLVESREHKTWAESEINYLYDNWGKISVPNLSKKLGRTENAIVLKAQRLKLGPYLDASGRYVSKNYLFKAICGKNSSGGYKNISWIKNKGLVTHKITRYKQTFDVIYLDEFWQWAFNNQSFLDFSNFEEYALGPEPEWVASKRRRDIRDSLKIKKSPWTEGEDKRLTRLLKEHKYGYKELSGLLKRTPSAIQRRICDLGLKERPIKADNHVRWTEQELLQLTMMIKDGCKYREMSEVLNKSSKAVQGLVFRYYLTERLDKVRAFIGNGNFGDGRPDIPLRYRSMMSPADKNIVKDYVSQLAGCILCIAKSKSNVGAEYSEYWQKDTCLNWDDVIGCTAHQKNCDSCTSYKRIPVQYCKRCGKDFFERKPNDFCEDCRIARIKQHRRKWAILNKRKSE